MFITFMQTQAEIIDEDIKYADKLLVETKLAQVPITNQHDDHNISLVNVLCLCLSGHCSILSYLLQLSSLVSLGCEFQSSEGICTCVFMSPGAYEHCEAYNIMLLVSHNVYSGTPLNRHPSTVDTCNTTDISECPDRISIDLNTFKTPQQRTPHYFV